MADLDSIGLLALNNLILPITDLTDALRRSKDRGGRHGGRKEKENQPILPFSLTLALT